MKLLVKIEVPDNLEPCTYGCKDLCTFASYNDDTQESDCNHIEKVGDNFECFISKAMKKDGE